MWGGLLFTTAESIKSFAKFSSLKFSNAGERARNFSLWSTPTTPPPPPRHIIPPRSSYTVRTSSVELTSLSVSAGFESSPFKHYGIENSSEASRIWRRASTTLKVTRADKNTRFPFKSDLVSHWMCRNLLSGKKNIENYTKHGFFGQTLAVRAVRQKTKQHNSFPIRDKIYIR